MSGLFFTEVNMQVIIHNEVANTLVKYELTNSFSKFTNNFIITESFCPNRIRTKSTQLNYPMIEIFPLNTWGIPVNSEERFRFKNNNDLKQNYEQVLKDWLSLQMLERSL